MKKIVISFILLFLISSCSDDDSILTPNNQNTFKEIAYNSLSDNEKENIIIDWREAKLYEGTLQTDESATYIKLSSGEKMYFFVNLDGYKISVGKKLVGVSFQTKHDALLGPLIVIVDPYDKIVIGFVGRM